MTASNSRNVPPITINWPVVDRLMAASDVKTDAALAARGGTHQSTILRARRGAASPAAMRAVKTAFPDASLDDLLVIPDAA